MQSITVEAARALRADVVAKYTPIAEYRDTRTAMITEVNLAYFSGQVLEPPSKERLLWLMTLIVMEGMNLASFGGVPKVTDIPLALLATIGGRVMAEDD